MKSNLPLDELTNECPDDVEFITKAFMLLLPDSSQNEEVRELSENMKMKREDRKRQISKTKKVVEQVLNLVKTGQSQEKLFDYLGDLTKSSPLFFYNERLGHICPNRSNMSTITKYMKNYEGIWKNLLIVSIGCGDGFFEHCLERFMCIENEKEIYHVELAEKKDEYDSFLSKDKELFWSLSGGNWIVGPSESVKSDANVIMMVMPTLGKEPLEVYMKEFPNTRMVLILGDDTCNPNPLNEDFYDHRFESIVFEKMTRQEYYIRIFLKKM